MLRPIVHVVCYLIYDITVHFIACLCVDISKFSSTSIPVTQFSQGLGTAEGVLIEILCTRTNKEIAAIKQEYKRSEHDSQHEHLQLTDVIKCWRPTWIDPLFLLHSPEFGRDIEKDVVADTSGHFKRLLVSMLTVRPPQLNSSFVSLVIFLFTVSY